MYPNLKLEIFKRGIRQNHLAKLLGIHDAILSKIIHGYREPSVAQRKLLAEYLEVDEAWLFAKYEDASSGRIPNHAATLQGRKDGES